MTAEGPKVEEGLVYHGTKVEFDSDHAIPRRNTRYNSKKEIIFDEESFHATPEKWIALAYTCGRPSRLVDGTEYHYNMSISLYENDKTVHIFGTGSLEESLEILYGDGGYVYHFDKDKFIYKEGLGNLEVIVNQPTKPIQVERVDNPVEEMKKLGVSFKYIDLTLPENEKYRI